jgi:hypothetical protein
MTSEQKIADACRTVALRLERALEEGRRSRRIDAEDLRETLLAVADELDPQVRDSVPADSACPECGERHADRLVWEDSLVRCASCGITFDPVAG